MKILIVGANSILSKAIIRLHSEDEADVVYHSKPIAGTFNNYPISDLKNLDKNYDLVYIVSAFITNDINENESVFEVNVKLIKDISDKFSKSKLVYFSTVAVYDGIESGTIDESTKPCPESIYAISKLWGEKIVQHHPKFSIVRISSMFGIGMNESTFLPKIIENALLKKQIALTGNGSRTQNYIHTNDVALLAKKLALLSENKIQLATASGNYTNVQVAEIVKELTGCEITYQGIDNSRSVEYHQNIIPYSEYNKTSLKEGIKELIEWKRKQF